VKPPLPSGCRLERLAKGHSRRRFASGQPLVDDWLHTKALQHQEKRLSTSKVLLDADGHMLGFYTLAMELVDFSDLPPDVVRRLPKRRLPVAVLAWLGVAQDHQKKGLGRLLLALALDDCAQAGKTFAFVAVILDCIDDDAKRFYQRFDFEELPGRPYRLFLSAAMLARIVGE
jgi:GNAT superfamily N-acetyltransferase